MRPCTVFLQLLSSVGYFGKNCSEEFTSNVTPVVTKMAEIVLNSGKIDFFGSENPQIDAYVKGNL